MLNIPTERPLTTPFTSPSPQPHSLPAIHLQSPNLALSPHLDLGHPQNTNQNSRNKKQSCSQLLLLSLIKWLIVIYAVFSLLAIPLWVINAIQFNKWIHTDPNFKPDIIDYILLTTTAHLHHPSSSLPPTPSPQTHSRTYPLSPTLPYSTVLQLLLFLSFFVLEYLTFQLKQKYKGNYVHIEDYTIEIRNVPIGDPYIVLPKLEEFVIGGVRNRFELVFEHGDGDQGEEVGDGAIDRRGNLRIFGAVSAIGEQKYWEGVGEREKERRVSQEIRFGNIGEGQEMNKCKHKIQKIQKRQSLLKTSTAKTDTIWLTFQTRQARYLALRFLQTSPQKFLSKTLHPHKAPPPLQLNWQNLHTPLPIILVSNNLILLVSLLLLILFDLVILLIHKSQYPLLSILVILILQIILKQTILTISTLEKHRVKSLQSLSIFSKLTKFLYINNAFIGFISCFDFGNRLGLISTRSYSGIGYKWFRYVGINVIIGYGIQIVYVNIRPWMQDWKKRILSKIISNLSNCSQSQSQPEILYSHLLSTIMFANSYTLTHPILFPIQTLFLCLSYVSHKKYLQLHPFPASSSSSPSSSSSQLPHIAIQYLYISLIGYCFVVGFGYGNGWVLGIGVGIGVVLALRYTLVQYGINGVRKKIGPFCFGKYERIHASQVGICTHMGDKELRDKITELRESIEKFTVLYNTKYSEEETYANRACLERYIRKIEERIARYEDIRRKKLQGKKQKNHDEKQEAMEKRNNGINKIQEDKKIKGPISYCLNEEILDF